MTFGPARQLGLLLAALLAAHLLRADASEPFFNNDEIRHTMTGAFVRDALADLPASSADPKGYAVRYYVQYPALGLLVWPPFFYLVEGLAMLAFGPTFLVGRLCVGALAALAVVYAYRFARLRLPHPPALLAAALVGIAPLVFMLSQRVMLEVPTLALALMAVVHFEKYLRNCNEGVALPPHPDAGKAGRPTSPTEGEVGRFSPPPQGIENPQRPTSPPVGEVDASRRREAGGGDTNSDTQPNAAASPMRIGAPDAILACLFAALAALTRFDAVFLLPYFAIRLVATRQFNVLLKRPVIVGVAVALALVAPYYLYTYQQYGGTIAHAAQSGTNPEAVGAFARQNLAFYPLALRGQLGEPLTAVGLIGLIFALWKWPSGCGPAVALIASVYMTFTPLAELEPRHTIYWIPAWAVLAARLASAAFAWDRRAGGTLVAALLIGTGGEANRQAFRWVRGYEDAAKWMLDHRETDRPVLADGELSGSIVYHVRLNDPARRVTVLRGDKLLYAMLSDPTTGYRSFADSSAAVLAKLHDHDPELVVVEDPQPTFRERPVPGAVLLAKTLREHPEQYRLETAIDIRSNYDRFDFVKLVVYRKLHRNPTPVSAVRVEVIGLGKALGGE